MEGKRSKNDQEESNYEKEAAAAADVEKEEKKMLYKTLGLIERQLDTCNENERRTQLAQNIREILDQMPENVWNGIQEEIYGEIPKKQQIPLIESSSAEKALQIAVVVRHVLSNLDSSSVLACRLVCKIWEDEATRQLLTAQHENMFKIRFRWCEKEGKSVYLHRKLKTLQDFHATCGNESRASANARRFLCSQTKIVFEGGDLRSTPEYFFNEFGVFLRFLSLKPGRIKTNTKEEFASTLHSILMDLTPNLQSLTFKSPIDFEGNILVNPESPNPNASSSSSSTSQQEPAGVGTGLEKLKVLKLKFFGKGMPGVIARVHIEQQNSLRQLSFVFQNPPENPDPGTQPLNPVIRKGIQRSPNLQLILDPDLMHTFQIVATGKFSLFKSLDLEFPPSEPPNSILFVALAAAGPKLSSLNLMNLKNVNTAQALNPYPHTIPTAAEMRALNSILQSSQSTLEEFAGVCHLKNWSEIQLPVFPLVKKLCLTQRFDDSDGPRINGRILPSGFDFDHVFPNLVSLQFGHLQEGKRNPFNFDGNANASSSLEHLEFAVNRDFNPLWMENISSLYPNLSSLHVKISDKFTLFPLVCKSIWSFLTQLTNLHLTVELNPQRNLNNQQENGGKKTEENEETNPVDEMDSIFTGFSRKFCRQLKQEDSTLPMSTTMRDDAFHANLRESPSVLDMKRLTELTISCVKIHPEELWSWVTEVHAFERIKQRQNVKVQVTQRL